MARHEQSREDLLAEATALVERVRFSLPDRAEPIVAGFRRDGAVSIFFGEDPVYQFNAKGELRRAYVDGLLLKAERGRLVSLRRERGPDAVALVRHNLSDEEASRFHEQARVHLQSLASALAAGHAQVLGEVPPGGDVLGRVRMWLAGLGPNIPIASSPRVR